MLLGGRQCDESCSSKCSAIFFFDVRPCEHPGTVHLTQICMECQGLLAFHIMIIKLVGGVDIVFQDKRLNLYSCYRRRIKVGSRLPMVAKVGWCIPILQTHRSEGQEACIKHNY